MIFHGTAWQRVVAAFAVAPAVLPIGYGLLSSNDMAWAGAATFGALSYAAALAFGVPLFVLFQRLGWRRVSHYACTGGFLGLLAAVPILLAGPYEVLPIAATGVGFGSACGIVLWWLLFGSAVRGKHRSSV